MGENKRGKSYILWMAIIILSLAALAAGALGSSGVINLDFGRDKIFDVPAENADINVEETFVMEGLNSISISTVSENVNIIPSQTGEIKVHFYGNTSHKKAAPQLEAFVSGNILTVRLKHTTSLIFGLRQNFKLDVYIPDSYSAGINIDTVSADVNTCRLKINDFSCSTVSGNFNTEGIDAAADIVLGTTSGDFKLEASSDNFTFESVSGDLECISLITDSTILESTSGSVKIDSFSGDLRHSSISGNLVLNYTQFAGNILSSAVSGNITLKLPASSEFFLDYSSTSGSVNNEFPITVTGQAKDNKLRGTVGNDKNKITVETVSGDLTIKRNTSGSIS
jgi:lia operon protein LiaG